MCAHLWLLELESCDIGTVTWSEVLALFLASTTQPEGARWRNGAPYHLSNFLPENQLFTVVTGQFTNQIQPVQRCVLDVTPSALSWCTPHLLLWYFPYLESTHRVFNLYSLLSCASYIFTCFSIMCFLITLPHLSFGLHIFRCPPTSMLSLLYLLQSFSPHGLNISVSLLFFFSLMFTTPALALISSFPIFSIFFIPIIHLNILILVQDH